MDTIVGAKQEPRGCRVGVEKEITVDTLGATIFAPIQISKAPAWTLMFIMLL